MARGSHLAILMGSSWFKRIKPPLGLEAAEAFWFWSLESVSFLIAFVVGDKLSF